MINLRRIYVYLVSAITLQAVVWSVIALMRNLTRSGAHVASSSAIAAQVAMILVGLPLFLAHWLWAQRSAAGNDAERGSAVRRLYLDAMLLSFIVPLLNSVVLLLQSSFDMILGTNAHILLAKPSSGYYAITILVTGIMAAYHFYVRRQDDRTNVQDDATIILDQLLIYILTLTGLGLTAFGVAQLISLLAAVPAAAHLEVDRNANVADYLSLIIAALPLWIICWHQAQQRFINGDLREQSSIVRKAALYLIVLLSSLTAVVTASILLANLLLDLLAVPSSSGGLADALSVIIVSVVIWAYYARVLQRDAVVADAVGQAALVTRIYLYLVSGVGLTAVLGGTGGILSVLIRALDGSGLGPDLREQLAWFTATLIAGLPVWLISWRRIQQAVAEPGAAGSEERGAFTRRLYLTVFAFAAVLTLLGGAVYVVAQLVELILGSRTTSGLLTDMGQALAYTLIAVAVLIYHGLLLRNDQRLLNELEIQERRQLNVAVVDTSNGRLGRVLVDYIQSQLPGIVINPVPLTNAAAEVMTVDKNKHSFAEILTAADVIVAPWQVAGSSQDTPIEPEVIHSFNQSTAHKLILPQPRRGISWIGVEPWQEKEIAREVGEAINNIAQGNKPAASRKLSTPAIVIAVLASLCGLTFIVPLLIQLIAILMDL